MSTSLIAPLVSVVLAAIVGWGVPALAARMLVPTLEVGPVKVTNYRGRSIPVGLGLVWAAWAVGVSVFANLAGIAIVAITGGAPFTLETWRGDLLALPFSAATPLMPILLVIGAVAFGLADDVFGDSAAKGFRGHIAALRAGRLTTGMLKLLGIGLLALAVARGIEARIQQLDPMVGTLEGWPLLGMSLLAWVLATLVIALAANLVNLTDLRPGRAMKAYTPLALLGVGLATWQGAVWFGVNASEMGVTSSANVWIAAFALCMTALMLGPVVALWRYDLGERAMLGDAGANAMGAVAGYVIAANSPLWLLAVVAAVLLALNLASERVSFTAVIEKVAVLKWIDGLGRLAAETSQQVAGQGSDEGAQAGGPDSTGDDARRDDVS